MLFATFCQYPVKMMMVMAFKSFCHLANFISSADAAATTLRGNAHYAVSPAPVCFLCVWRGLCQRLMYTRGDRRCHTRQWYAPSEQKRTGTRTGKCRQRIDCPPASLITPSVRISRRLVRLINVRRYQLHPGVSSAAVSMWLQLLFRVFSPPSLLPTFSMWYGLKMGITETQQEPNRTRTQSSWFLLGSSFSE